MLQKRETIPADSLKKREPSKNIQKPIKSLVKLRKWNNFIGKFQNLKHKLIPSEPTKRKLTWKIT